MPSPLLDPGNRLLGWATGDLSLYGALPAVTIGTAAPPAADPTLLTVPSTPAFVAPAQSRPEAAEAAQDVAATPTAEDAMPAATSPAALQSVTLPTALAPEPSAQTFSPQVATPSGSGSTAPIVADTSLPFAGRAADAEADSSALTHGLAASSLAAPVLQAGETVAQTTAAALAPTLATLAPTLDLAEAAIAGTVAAVGASVSETGALLDGVGADAAGLVDSAAGTLDGASALTDGVPAVDPVTDFAVGGATDTISTIGTGVGEGVAATGAVVDGLGAAVGSAPLTDSLAATAGDAAGLVAGDLSGEGFGGSDPAGGVTTLVSMVETAAVFEVGQPADQPAPDAAGSIVDTLAADEAPGTLLGDAAHVADTDEGGILPHHDDGVPGLL